VRLQFFKPDKRARDWDNMLAAMKSGLDGLADAMGVDDSRWRLSFDVADETVPGGLVLVSVEVTT
jgi:crossover junction endodeoxyribonuclease RusA